MNNYNLQNSGLDQLQLYRHNLIYARYDYFNITKIPVFDNY